MTEEKEADKGIEKEAIEVLDKDTKDKEIASLKVELNEIKSMLNLLLSNKISTNQPENQTPNPLTYAESFQSSTGNEGVPTDRQTIQQPTKSQSEHISELLKEYRTELMLKFKGLTKQEFKVFSAVYILEQEGNRQVSYSLLAQKLGLTESSIRDYIMRLERKGIPVDKTKINNKLVILKIKPELKQLSTLENLSKLRETRFTE